MSAIIRSVVSAKRNGGIAEICLETTDGDSVSMDVDVRFLWAIAADFRAASIDLLAPVPDALKSALTVKSGIEASPDNAGASTPSASSDDETPEEPKGGFAGLEQAWDLCDRLNEALLNQEDAVAVDVFKTVALGSVLIDPAEPLRPLENDGIEVDLRNEFKIVYRSETRDWVPDRRDRDGEPAPEIG